MLTMIIAAIPTVIGVTQGLRYQEQAEADDGEPHWFNLYCSVSEEDKVDGSEVVNGAKVVLIANKLFLLTPNSLIAASGFPFTGLFHDYPFKEGVTGMVSHIGSDPPALNWIFADSSTAEIEYGPGSASKEEGKIVGEWTHENVIVESKVTEGKDNEDDNQEAGKVQSKKKAILDGEGGFVAVEKEVDAGAVVENLWQIYWARGLAGDEGLRRVKVSLMVDIVKEDKKEEEKPEKSGEGQDGTKKEEGGDEAREGGDEEDEEQEEDEDEDEEDEESGGEGS